MTHFLTSLIASLLAFFVLADHAAPPDNPDSTDEDDPVVEDPVDEVVVEAAEEEVVEDEDPKVIAANTRAEAAEKREREANDRFVAAERNRATPPAAPTPDPFLKEQNEIIANPQSTEMQKWTAQGNLTMAESRRVAQEALFQSRNMADRAEFDRMVTEKPAFKKYSERVETKLQELSGQGLFPGRKFVLQMLVGEDALSGKAISKKPATPAASKPVPRGAPPMGRSDTRGRGGAQSESQKRYTRLENLAI